MRFRDRPLLVLGASQIFVTSAALAFHLVMRPALIDAYADSSLPAITALALSSWLVPMAAGVGLATMIAAALAPGSRARRLRAMSAGLVVSGFVFIGASLSAIAPLFGD